MTRLALLALLLLACAPGPDADDLGALDGGADMGTCTKRYQCRTIPGTPHTEAIRVTPDCQVTVIQVCRAPGESCLYWPDDHSQWIPDAGVPGHGVCFPWSWLERDWSFVRDAGVDAEVGE